MWYVRFSMQSSRRVWQHITTKTKLKIPFPVEKIRDIILIPFGNISQGQMHSELNIQNWNV